MSRFVQRRPRRTRIEGEEAIIAELRRRTPKRGMRKAVAHELGVTTVEVTEVLNGNRPVPPRMAAALGHKLAWVPIEPLHQAASGSSIAIGAIDPLQPQGRKDDEHPPG